MILRRPEGSEARAFQGYSLAAVEQLERLGHVVIEHGLTSRQLLDCRRQFETSQPDFESPEKHYEAEQQRHISAQRGTSIADCMTEQRDRFLRSLTELHPGTARFGMGTDVFSLQQTAPGGSTRIHRDADDILFVTLASQLTGGPALVEVWEPVEELVPPSIAAPYQYQTGDGMSLGIRNIWPWPLAAGSDGGIFHRVHYPASAGLDRHVATIASRLSVPEALALHLYLHRSRRRSEPESPLAAAPALRTRLAQAALA